MKYSKYLFNFVFAAFPLITAPALEGHAAPLANCVVTLDDGKAFQYPEGLSPDSEKKQFFQFGFESEYELSESGPLLELYKPTKIRLKKWEKMPSDQKIDWVKTNLNFDPVAGSKNGLQLVKSKSPFSFLPPDLAVDATGNLEIILKPMDTYGTIRTAVDKINEKFGTGSMQITVSIPYESFFFKPQDGQKVSSVDILKGFFNFVHDHDILEKMSAGAERFAKNQTSQVMRSFNHPFLGPMNTIRQRRLMKYLEENSQGNLLDDKSLGKVRRLDEYFKYIGGSSYRPDVAAKVSRAAVETRDAHKNVDVLFKRLDRNMAFFIEKDSQLAKFKEVPSVDLVSDYNKFSATAQSALSKIFPTREVPGIEYFPDGSTVNQVYRNFSYPLRNWASSLEAMGALGNLATVQQAQQTYQARVDEISQRFIDNAITRDQAAALIQGALAKFANESTLFQLYDQHSKVYFRTKVETDNVIPLVPKTSGSRARSVEQPLAS